MITLDLVHVSDTSDGLMLSMSEQSGKCRLIRRTITLADATDINQLLAKQPISSTRIRQVIEANRELGRTLKSIEIKVYRHNTNFYALLTWLTNGMENTEVSDYVLAAFLSIYHGISPQIDEVLLEKQRVPEHLLTIETISAVAQMTPEEHRNALIANLPNMPIELLKELMGIFNAKHDHDGATLVKTEIENRPSQQAVI